MEVIVSAAVLVIVVLGVLAATDAVTKTAGSNKARTVAATLAELDLERLRSLPTSELDKLDELEPLTREVQVEKVNYTIKSEAKWVTDSTGDEISCAVAPNEGSYMRITSTVTSPITGKQVKPVVISSIVAPRPGKGTLTGMVKNAAGQPEPGVAVQAIGPSPATKVTNSAGCAIFDESEAGSYKVKLNTTGWVDPDGNTAPEKGATVSAGNLTTVEFVYDRKSSFTVAVKTKRPGAGAEVADVSTGVTAGHTGLTTKAKLLSAAAPGASSFLFDPMFPFPTPYQVYSGTCVGNDPTKYIPNFFAGRPSSVVQLTPGGPAVSADVLEPALDVTAKSGSSNVSGANVYAYPTTTGTGCSTARITLGPTGSNGKVTNPGLPFGTYDICADYRVGSGSRTRVSWAGLTNSNLAGTALTATFPSGTSSACP